MAEPPAGPDSPGFEVSDVASPRAGLWAYGLLAVAVTIAAAVYGLWWLLSATTVRPPVSPIEAMPMPPPQPPLQTAPDEDLARFRAAEQARLGSVGWVDRASGIVHIPVARAMQMLAEQGWPGAGPPPVGGGR